MSDLAQFLQDYVHLHGGDYDRGPDILSLLPPPGLGSSDVQSFWLGPGEPQEGERLFPGHPFLEAVLQKTRSQSRLLQQHATVSPSLRPALSQELARFFTVRNASLNCGPPRRELSSWLTFTYAVTYLWDDKRQEIRSVTIDSQHRCPLDPGALAKNWLEPGRLGGERQSDELYELSQKFLADQMKPRLEHMQREAAGYLQVELARVERYYQELLHDLSRRQSSEEKAARTLAELESRKHDLEEKFKLRVQANLIQLRVVDLARTHLDVKLSRSSASQKPGEAPLHRTVVFTHNPLTQDFDLFPCDYCRSGTRLLALCGQAHLTCEHCYQECRECRLPLCAVCLGERPPKRCQSCQQRPKLEEKAPEPKRKEASAKRAPTSAAPRPSLSDLFYDFRASDLHALLAPLDETLNWGNVAKTQAGLRALLDRINPEQEALVNRLRQVLRCFKTPAIRVVDKALTELQSSLTPVRRPTLAKKSAPTEQRSSASSNALVRALHQGLAGVKQADYQHLLNMAEKVWPALRAETTLTPEAVAACVVYASFDQSQKFVANLFGVSSGTISMNYRKLTKQISRIQG